MFLNIFSYFYFLNTKLTTLIIALLGVILFYTCAFFLNFQLCLTCYVHKLFCYSTLVFLCTTVSKFDEIRFSLFEMS